MLRRFSRATAARSLSRISSASVERESGTAMGSSGRFGVLLCAPDSEYVKERYGGYFGIFTAMLGEEGELWDEFRPFAGELPGDGEIGKYDGFVVTGSCSDAYGDDAWILDLLAFLKKLVSMKKKVLGICFGHQILSRALGGTVGRATSWDIGLRTIDIFKTLSPDLLSQPALSIIECHRDEVKEVADGVEVVGRSDKTGIEMFKFEGHIMGIQGHPEYTQDILLHLIDRLLIKGLITESFGDELKVKISVRGACETDKEAWRRICINFLKKPNLYEMLD